MGLKDTVAELTLRPLAELDRQDLLRILEIRNQEKIRTNMYNAHVISAEEHFDWAERTKNDPAVRFFAVLHNDEIIGAVSLNALNSANKRSDWAYYLDTTLQGKGVGAALEYKFLNYVFFEAGLEKLNCEVLDFNEKVVSIHKKFGFLEEGFRRDHISRDDGKHGIFLLGITKPEWEAKKRDLDKTLFK